MVDIKGPYPAVLSLSNVLDQDSRPNANVDLSKYLQRGDLILAKIVAFDRTRDPLITMNFRGGKKLVSGRMIEVNPVKVPRIIGKQGSMINLLQRITKSNLFTGQNGRILINSPNFETEQIVIEAIMKITKESHISGLTDRIKLFLQEKIENLVKE